MRFNDCAPSWQEQEGLDNLGPRIRPLSVTPVGIVRPAYLHPRNEKVLAEAPFSIYKGNIASPLTQIFQVVPTGWFDTLVVAAKDTSGLGVANQIFGNFELRLPSTKVGVPDGGLDNNFPDFCSSPFTDFQTIRVDLPFGSIPFYVHFFGSDGTAFNVSITLESLGF